MYFSKGVEGKAEGGAPRLSSLTNPGFQRKKHLKLWLNSPKPGMAATAPLSRLLGLLPGTREHFTHGPPPLVPLPLLLIGHTQRGLHVLCPHGNEKNLVFTKPDSG